MFSFFIYSFIPLVYQSLKVDNIRHLKSRIFHRCGKILLRKPIGCFYELFEFRISITLKTLEMPYHIFSIKRIHRRTH